MTHQALSVLITGAAKRVGRCMALAFAEAGYRVLFTYRSSKEEANSLTSALSHLNADPVSLQIDMDDPDSPLRIAAWASSQTSSLHTLINNASIFWPSPMKDLTLDQVQQQMRVNYEAPLMLTQHCLPLLQAASTTLTNESSATDHPASPCVINIVDTMLNHRARSGFVAYNASKAALQEATLCLARELAPKIRVNGIAPGAVIWHAAADEAYQERVLQRVPLGRVGSGEDIAKAALFLATQAPYITGEILRVDGGRWLG